MEAKLIAQAAEAKIYLEETGQGKKIIKDRISKGYRHPELDKKLIKQRTKKEAKILEKASKLIPAPLPENMEDTEKARTTKIVMPYVEGKKLSDELEKLDWKEICKKIGEQIAKLHDADIIHGDLTTSNMILSKHEKSTPKIDEFRGRLVELEKLNFQLGEYAIFGSGPLAIRGIRASEDIDLIVNKELWGLLEKKHKVEQFKTGPTRKVFIKIGKIEIYPNWLPWLPNTEELIQTADIIDGFPFVKLEYVLKWKKMFNKDKDQEDIKLIEKYISSEKEKLFFIDFGLGFISSRIEDKAVDLHLIKQALEAKHFSIHKEAEKIILDNYNSKDRTKILEQLKKVEARGRYKH